MIKIGYSCPEKLHKMTQSSEGYSCQSCQQIVYDFTGKSNEEIASILMTDRSIKCGVFLNSQAKEKVRSRVNLIFRMAFYIVFLLGLDANAFSQITEPDQNVLISVQDSVINDRIEVRGVVYDENYMPFPFVKIVISNGNDKRYLITDMDGNYKIQIPDDWYGLDVELTIKSIGYQQKTILIPEIKINTYSVDAQLETDENIIITGIIINTNPPLIDKDPYQKTVIKGDDLKYWTW